MSVNSYPLRFGRYELLKRVAVGGMAELFLAQVDGPEGFARQVVIKRLLPHMAADTQFTSMFIDEAKLTAQLVHPKIAQTYELGKHGEQLFIAMEFVDGIDILALLRECAKKKVKVPDYISVHIMHEVLDALDFAHNQVGNDGQLLGIVHRDVSPSNIILSTRGDIKLVDFGIARASQQSHKTQAGTLKGKYGYMSPEQVLDGDIDWRSDLFSVGIVLAELLSGRRLFAAANELDVLLMVRDAKLERYEKYAKGIDPGLDAIVRRALQKNVDERYPDAASFRNALAEWLFEQRKRVGPPDIAEIVSELYDNVWAAKQEMMNAPIEGADGSVSGPKVVAGSIGQQSQPSIQLGSDLAQANNNTTAEIEIVDDDVSGPVTAELDVSGLAGPKTAELDIESLDDATSEIELADEGSGNTGELDVELDYVEAPASPQAASFEAYPSIQKAVEDIAKDDEANRQAVAEITIEEPDPSAYEFDKSDVASVVENRRRAKQTLSPQRIKEIREAAAEPPAPSKEMSTISGDAQEEGDFKEKVPIRVFYEIGAQKKTGLLVVSVGGIRKDIYWKEGAPTFVSSNVAGELFGEYLVKEKALSEGELSMALAMMPHFGGKLGETLVGLGLMKPLDVFRNLNRQVSQKLIDVCTWGKGSYSWFASKSPEQEEFPLDLNTFEILAQGVSALSDNIVHSWVEGHSQLVPTACDNPTVDLGEFQYGAQLLDVYASLMDNKTIGQLWEEELTDDNRSGLGRCLYLLYYTEFFTT